MITDYQFLVEKYGDELRFYSLNSAEKADVIYRKPYSLVELNTKGLNYVSAIEIRNTLSDILEIIAIFHKIIK